MTKWATDDADHVDLGDLPLRPLRGNRHRKRRRSDLRVLSNTAERSAAASAREGANNRGRLLTGDLPTSSNVS